MDAVICIDGPSGAGKGTISRMVAKELGFNYLDSGALYRVLAAISAREGLSVSNHQVLAKLAQDIHVEFTDGQVLYKGEDISQQIRTEETGNRASKLAANVDVREALLESQRQRAKKGGLVADGRDMGTVVFPAAELKIFLTASAEERARRRQSQLAENGHYDDSKNDPNRLIHKGDGDSLRALVDEIRARDERDSNRKVSPLRPAEDAIQIDSTSMKIEEVVAEVLKHWKQRA